MARPRKGWDNDSLALTCSRVIVYGLSDYSKPRAGTSSTGICFPRHVLMELWEREKYTQEDRSEFSNIAGWTRDSKDYKDLVDYVNKYLDFGYGYEGLLSLEIRVVNREEEISKMLRATTSMWKKMCPSPLLEIKYRSCDYKGKYRFVARSDDSVIDPNWHVRLTVPNDQDPDGLVTTENAFPDVGYLIAKDGRGMPVNHEKLGVRARAIPMDESRPFLIGRRSPTSPPDYHLDFEYSSGSGVNSQEMLDKIAEKHAEIIYNNTAKSYSLKNVCGTDDGTTIWRKIQNDSINNIDNLQHLVSSGNIILPDRNEIYLDKGMSNLVQLQIPIKLRNGKNIDLAHNDHIQFGDFMTVFRIGLTKVK